MLIPCGSSTVNASDISVWIAAPTIQRFIINRFEKKQLKKQFNHIYISESIASLV